MKRTLNLIACVAVCCAMMVSCKSAKTVEPTPEEIQQQKQALADSVLAQIDEFAEQYWNAQSESSIFRRMKLTEEEKMVKPHYLLDPSVADTFVTKSQKVNALAFYVVELGVRELYEMPTEEVGEAIAKLATELNYPFDFDQRDANVPTSELIKSNYEKCKNNDELALFWQFEWALVTDVIYVLSQNPELFLGKITEEQWQAWSVVKQTRLAAIEELAKYDTEMAKVQEFIKKNRTVSGEESKRINQSIEVAKQYYVSNKEKYASGRNSLLQ